VQHGTRPVHNSQANVEVESDDGRSISGKKGVQTGLGQHLLLGWRVGPDPGLTLPLPGHLDPALPSPRGAPGVNHLAARAGEGLHAEEGDAEDGIVGGGYHQCLIPTRIPRHVGRDEGTQQGSHVLGQRPGVDERVREHPNKLHVGGIIRRPHLGGQVEAAKTAEQPAPHAPQHGGVHQGLAPDGGQLHHVTGQEHRELTKG
jgi:hypothetical protein